MSAEPQSRGLTARPWLAALPLVIFLALAVIFYRQLDSGQDTAVVPSALIGQKAPETSLPPLDGVGLPGLDTKSFGGKVTLVNVFASWCAPCREEHPLLLELSQDARIAIAGLNYKDLAENARRFLGELGNPYAMIGTDEKGRAAINWGVYGVPETFLVGKDGAILYKQVGPLSPKTLEQGLKPAIEKALAQP